MFSKFRLFFQDLSFRVIVGLIVAALVSLITPAYLLFTDNPINNIKWLFITQLGSLSPIINLLTLLFTFCIFYKITFSKKNKLSLGENTDIEIPEFIFADRITLRKIYNGPNSNQSSNNPATSYALSVRIGIKNYEKIKVFNTKMTLCLIRFGEIKTPNQQDAKTNEQGNILYERHGIEEFESKADYVNVVHRFSFPIKDLSYLTIKPVIKCRGNIDYDKIEIIFSGFYGSNLDSLCANQIKPFFVSKKYNFTDIKFANRTEKITQYILLSGELHPKVEWSNFKQEPYDLSPLEKRSFEKELGKILMEKNSGRNCLIVGGGISGLVAATHLKSQGFKVKILDKGRSIGGRLATRRINHPHYGEGIFDYGAQYITARSDDFKKWLDEWLDLGLVDVWTCASKFSEDLEKVKYRGVHSTRSIAQHLASNLDVQTATKIVKLSWSKAGWTVSADDGNEYYSNILVMTPPLPQSIQLLRDSSIPISEISFDRLSRVSYNMCLAVLMIVSAPIQIAQGGSCNVKGEKLDWITCNHQKGVSPNCYAVTLHANPTFSEEHYNQDKRDSGAQELIEEAKKYLKEAKVIEYQVHVWRYSTPVNPLDEPFFSPQKSSDSTKEIGPLYLAGDAFSSRYKQDVSSLENAFLSGLEVAKYICEQQKN